MTENPKLEGMGSDHLVSNCLTGESGEDQKLSVVHRVNGLHHSTTKSDSFTVNMEQFAHLVENDTTNSADSKIMLQRNHSRKGSMRSAERKVVSNERDVSMLATSPRVTFHGGSMPQKPAVVATGPHDRPISPQVHHQITITSASTAAAESESGGKRLSCRRSSPTWTINPRRIFFFFATLSCMGTILLIYFTLSMGEENVSNY